MKKSYILIFVCLGILVLIGVVGIVREVLEERNVKKILGIEDRGNAIVQEGGAENNGDAAGEDSLNVQQNPQPEISKNQPNPQKDSFPVLKNLGVNIDAWNRQTNLAGDLIFSKKLLFDDGRVSNDKVLLDFGSKDKYRINDIGSIEYWYYVPLKTKVRAPVDGKVQVVFFDHTQDWGVNFMQEGSSWIVSFEHIVNVVVKDGDIAKAGDIVGEAAPRNTYNKEIAMVELAVWKSGQQIIKYCPFNFLDRSLRPTFKDKIERVANEWEEFIGKDVYQQDKWVAPGCLVDSIVEK